MPPNLFNWMSERWLGGVAFIYTMVVIFDLIVLPFYYENKEVVFSKDELTIIEQLPLDNQMDYLRKRRYYKPVTLDAGSVIHLAFGAVLTFGVREKARKAKVQT